MKKRELVDYCDTCGKKMSYGPSNKVEGLEICSECNDLKFEYNGKCYIPATERAKRELGAAFYSASEFGSFDHAWMAKNMKGLKVVPLKEKKT